MGSVGKPGLTDADEVVEEGEIEEGGALVLFREVASWVSRLAPAAWWWLMDLESPLFNTLHQIMDLMEDVVTVVCIVEFVGLSDQHF